MILVMVNILESIHEYCRIIFSFLLDPLSDEQDEDFFFSDF